MWRGLFGRGDEGRKEMCRCDPPAVLGLPALLLRGEAEEAMAALARHPSLRRSGGTLQHALLICDLCLTLNFPSAGDVLATYDDRTRALRSLDGDALELAAWRRTHPHVQGCAGIGREDILSLRPATVSLAVLELLVEGLRGKYPPPLGPWTRRASNLATRDALAIYSRYKDDELDRTAADVLQQLDLTIAGIQATAAVAATAAPAPRPRGPGNVATTLSTWDGTEEGLPPYSLEDPHQDIPPPPPVHASLAPGLSFVGVCLRCQEQTDLVALYKCGHVAVCALCAYRLKRGGHGCLACGEPITLFVRLRVASST